MAMVDPGSMICYSGGASRCSWCLDLLFYQGEDVRSLPLKERRVLDQVAKRYGLQKSELFIGCGKLFDTVCDMDLAGGSSPRVAGYFDLGGIL
jgi:hypothetical protein